MRLRSSRKVVSRSLESSVGTCFVVNISCDSVICYEGKVSLDVEVSISRFGSGVIPGVKREGIRAIWVGGALPRRGGSSCRGRGASTSGWRSSRGASDVRGGPWSGRISSSQARGREWSSRGKSSGGGSGVGVLWRGRKITAFHHETGASASSVGVSASATLVIGVRVRATHVAVRITVLGASVSLSFKVESVGSICVWIG